MLGVGEYVWRLIPANPILLRVVDSGGKRTRDALIRCGYLGLLIGLVVVLLLSSGEIVLGSLLSRLFFVIALLVSGIPIFSITQIFGGVAIKSIVLSFGLAAATAFATGALAMAIATFKVGTRRTIFSFYLFIVVYLIGGVLLDRLPYFHFNVHLSDGSIVRSDTSWLTGIHPFLALRTLFHEKE